MLLRLGLPGADLQKSSDIQSDIQVKSSDIQI